MTEHGNIYEKGLREFLLGKIEHHRERSKHHRIQMEEAKSKLLLIDGHQSTTSETDNNSDVIVHPESDFSLSAWRPKVFKALSESDAPLTSDEILSRTDFTLTSDKELRKKAIGAISNSLQSFIKDGKVGKVENIGRGNKYEIQKASRVSEAS